jgi:ribosomal protein S18 acetylase RimI-like enzyme
VSPRVADWPQVQRGLHRHRVAGVALGTNLFALREEVEAWIGSGRLEEAAFADATLFLLREDGFQRVFHAAADLPGLSEALSTLPRDGALIADLVGRAGDLGPWVSAYHAAGFAERRVLQRMFRSGGAPPPASGSVDDVASDVVRALPDDAEAVSDLLSRLLDPYTEPLPTLDLLRRAAEGGTLLVARRGPVVAGVLWFERQGGSVHLRHWHLEPSARGAGLGGRMMRRFLADSAGAGRIVLWVVADNTASIAIYQHYGFVADGVVDRIMTRAGTDHPLPPLNPADTSPE